MRATIFSKTAIPAPDIKSGINQMFHLLHQFDIPVGSTTSTEQGKTFYEYTLATTVRDPQNLVMYFTTYEEPFTLQTLKMSDYDLNSTKMVSTPITGMTPYFTK